MLFCVFFTIIHIASLCTEGEVQERTTVMKDCQSLNVFTSNLSQEPSDSPTKLIRRKRSIDIPKLTFEGLAYDSLLNDALKTSTEKTTTEKKITEKTTEYTTNASRVKTIKKSLKNKRRHGKLRRFKTKAPKLY